METYQLDIIDIAQPGLRDSESLSSFEKLLDKICDSSDRNRENYSQLLTEYHDYPCFTLAKEGDQVVAFSGLNTKDFPDGVGRILSRFYLHDSKRLKGLSSMFRSHEEPRMTGPMIEAQLDKAKELNLAMIFTSVEFPRRRSFLTEYAEWLNHFKVGGGEWHVPEGFFLVTDWPADPRSWQSIMCKKLKNIEINLPRISKEEWMDKFSRPKLPSFFEKL